MAQGVEARDRLDAAGAGRDAGLRENVEAAGLAGGPDVGAAAQFHGHAGHLDHAHHVAVFLAEKGGGPLGPGGFDAEFLDDNRRVQQNGRVDLVLDLGQLLGGHGRDVGEVEAQAVRADQRTGLVDVAAQDVFERLVEQVGAGMVAGGGGADGGVHGQFGFLIEQDLALLDFDVVGGQLRPGFERAQHGHVAGERRHRTDVAGLAAGFAVEGGHGRDHVAGFAGDKPLHGLPFGGNERVDAAFGGKLRVAHEAGLHAGFEQLQEQHGRVGLARTLPGFLGPGLLLGHTDPVSVLVGGHAALAGHVVDDVQRESVGVVELEGEFAGDGGFAGPGHAVEFLGQDGQALVEGDAEAFFFLAHHAFHEFAAGDQLGIGRSHDVHHHAGGLVEEGIGQADQLPEPQRPADQAAQHVAPTLVGGHDAVGEQEGDRAAVVADDAQGGVVLVVVAVGHPGDLGGGADDGLEQVDVEIGVHALDHGRDAFQAHAGVDAGPGQGHAVAGLDLVELHEHEVPDFQVAVAVAGADAAVRAAAHFLAPVVHDFRAGAAGAGVAHGPEVILLAQAEDAFVGQAGDLFPQPVGLVVVEVDRGVEARLVQADDFGEELPGKLDGVFLEVVAKGEVAEHFKKGVVAGGAADVFQVVVLAAHAQAFLGRGGAGVAGLVLAQEHLLELHHAGVGEKERGVFARHQRRGRHDLMALGREIFQKLGANLGCRHHCMYASAWGWKTKGPHPPHLPR